MGNPVNIYLTADTIIGSLGFSTRENMQQIRNYQSGILSIDNPNLYESPFMGGLIDNDRLQKEVAGYGLEHYSRMEQLFILSIQEVIRQSHIEITGPDCILILSTTKGNINQSLPEMGNHIAGHFKLKHPPVIISTACISGVSALIIASRLIRNGNYKYAVVAGGDILTRFVISGFQSFKSVSPDICRPYDRRRDGLSLGEACGAVLVTSDRSFVHDPLPIVIEGGAITNDANHISGPSRTGDGLCLAISQAMAENKLEAEDLSFINTHGTATVYNDEMESKAVHLAGLDSIPLNSLKSYWGHTLGASGIIESIASMEELRSGELFGIYGFETSDVTHPLQLRSKHRSMPMRRCVKTASGFGGCNAAIVLALEANTKPLMIKEHKTIHIKSTCIIEAGKVILNNQIALETDPDDAFPTFIRTIYNSLMLDDRRFYKMDDLSKLGYIATAYLFSEINRPSNFKPEETGIILANASASLDSDLKHQHIIDTLGDKGSSPAVFVYTLPNVVMGEICIRYKIKGENTFFIQGSYNKTFIREYAQLAMQTQDLHTCIIGWCELLGDTYKAHFELLKKNKKELP